MDLQLVWLTFKEILEGLGVRFPEITMPTKLPAKIQNILPSGSLSVNDQQKLALLHPVVQTKVRKLLLEAKNYNLKVGVHSSLRTFEEQAALYAKGRKLVNGVWTVVDASAIVTKSKAGYSWHNYGLAVDVVFKLPDGEWSWSSKFNWKGLGNLGKVQGLVWGGEWVTLQDLPHFEYHPSLNIPDTLALYKKGGISEVWSRLI